MIRENNILYFVFEYMPENLYQLIKDRENAFPDYIIANLANQLLQGLSYMHSKGYYHRDLKVE